MKRKTETEWVNNLVECEFFGWCLSHGDFKKNWFCIDCNLCLCKQCLNSTAHGCGLHRRLQICKYVYHNVVRLHEIDPHFDCTLIQAYKINGEMAVHLNPKPQQHKDAAKKGGGTCCEACGRHIQAVSNRYCSIACKVLVSTTLRSTSRSNVDGNPSLETECETSHENVSLSITESSTDSSKVIQPRRRRRKGIPIRCSPNYISIITLGSRLWLKPPRNGLRVYFDGALSPLPAGGTGVFVSDETGRFIYGASKFYRGITCSQVIEMIALRDAVKVAHALQLSSCAFLGDSQLTILAVLRGAGRN